MRRNLLPSPPHLVSHIGPPRPHHLSHAISGKYTGCLGLSAEELEEASRFKEDMPKCEIVVNGTTVMANTLSSSASAESDSSNSNVIDVTTTTTSTVTTTSVYEDINTNQTGASGGSDDNIEDQDDEVNVSDDYDYKGDQSSASGGEEDNEDDAINDIEDSGNEDDTINNNEGSGNTSESVAYTEYEAALDETFTNDQVSSSTTTVDESSALVDESSALAAKEVDESSALAAEEVDETPNPLHLFDMKECSSFSALWMWDLALTCSNSTSLDSCSCTAAKILIQYGDIDCANDECPDDCPVCDTCMKLSGCVPTKELQRGANIEGDTAEAVPVAFIGLTAAMFGVQLVLFKMYWSRRSQPGGDLGSNLI